MDKILQYIQKTCTKQLCAVLNLLIKGQTWLLSLVTWPITSLDHTRRVLGAQSPILFSELGFSMASCSCIYIYVTTRFATWPVSKPVARFKAGQPVLQPVDPIPLLSKPLARFKACRPVSKPVNPIPNSKWYLTHYETSQRYLT